MSHTALLLWRYMLAECLCFRPRLTHVCLNKTFSLQLTDLVRTRSSHAEAWADLADPPAGGRRHCCSLLLTSIEKGELFFCLFYHGDIHWPIFDILHNIHVSAIDPSERMRKCVGTENVKGLNEDGVRSLQYSRSRKMGSRCSRGLWYFVLQRGSMASRKECLPWSQGDLGWNSGSTSEELLDPGKERVQGSGSSSAKRSSRYAYFIELLRRLNKIILFFF